MAKVDVATAVKLQEPRVLLRARMTLHYQVLRVVAPAPPGAEFGEPAPASRGFAFLYAFSIRITSAPPLEDRGE